LLLLTLIYIQTKYYDQVGIYLDGRELPINAQTSMNYDWIKLVDLTDIERNIYAAKKIKFSKTGSTKIQIQTILDRDSKPWKVENASCLVLALKYFKGSCM
jgi:hypothetical protein